MIEIESTNNIGTQIVAELTGEMAGIDDNIPMNKKYTLAILVYCNKIASKLNLKITDQKIIPSVFSCSYIITFE